ncbi:chorismate mutase [Mycobacteriaceae bacterium 1482268.1]|nr:chorismate mutase [Mycobacteriaceae bacterium 1482268.1]
MSRNRRAVLLVAASLLAVPMGLPATASAEPAGPLYRLVDTAAQRLATADPVAASKWIDGGPITDAQRADQVLNAVAADATAHGIDPNYVRAVFTDQIHATEGVEYTRFAQWKFDPAAAPTAAPDLAQSRAAIDGFNKVMVDEIALQWNSLHSPSCAVELQQAAESVGVARQLDPLYRQALSSATSSYCTTT